MAAPSLTHIDNMTRQTCLPILLPSGQRGTASWSLVNRAEVCRSWLVTLLGDSSVARRSHKPSDGPITTLAFTLTDATVATAVRESYRLMVVARYSAPSKPTSR